MKKTMLIIISLLVTTSIFSHTNNENQVIVGAQRSAEYLPLLEGKKVAIYSNHTGIVGEEHLLDLLIREKVNVTAIFSPEHGFRGSADAGELVKSSKDPKTGTPILSLYDGKDKKPSKKSMEEFDILIVDIQDVGLRFYTYYITMVRLMDACADYNKTMLILDRPNPNGHYVDGPILDMKHKSGVGYLPIPVVHGMTLAELAQMVNGEGWLPNKKKCTLEIVTCKNYTHKTLYQVPIAPSPNLPNMRSIYLYPAICLFEGTPISLGRGTNKPFQVYGHPDMSSKYSFTFTPKSVPGAKNPPLLNKVCYGVDLTTIKEDNLPYIKLDLAYIIDAYHTMNIGKDFFTPFFVKLIGVDYVQEMIIANKSACEIQAIWKPDVEKFQKQRKPYLLYEE